LLSRGDLGLGGTMDSVGTALDFLLGLASVLGLREKTSLKFEVRIQKRER
jgi:hypothetical protein